MSRSYRSSPRKGSSGDADGGGVERVVTSWAWTVFEITLGFLLAIVISTSVYLVANRQAGSSMLDSLTLVCDYGCVHTGTAGAVALPSLRHACFLGGLLFLSSSLPPRLFVMLMLAHFFVASDKVLFIAGSGVHHPIKSAPAISTSCSRVLF